MTWLQSLMPTSEGLVILTVPEVVGFLAGAVLLGVGLGLWL